MNIIVILVKKFYLLFLNQYFDYNIQNELVDKLFEIISKGII